MHPVIVIFAPTASGKTALARKIFGRSSLSVFKGSGEVISADSQAVYRGMDIGTAKPTPEETADIPHHLINLVNPDVQFGAGQWVNLADEKCIELWKRGKIPVVCGGTGFYVRNFLLGLPVTPESKPEIRQMLSERLKAEGNKKLYFELKQIDPESAKKININDAYRICRSLEVYYSSGRPQSSYVLPAELRRGFDFCTIIIRREKEELYRRIDERVDRMFDAGLEREVEKLKAEGYGIESPGMKAIGYSEFFLEGLNSDQIRERIKIDSRKYAKKQYTFMRDIPQSLIFDACDEEGILNCITSFLSKASL